MLHLDAIAQIIILLGAICHVVAGLRTEICEFIINTAILLVQLAMGTTSPLSQGPEAAYNANQEFILKKLPTSLYTALSKFDVESETTLYAACPTCNFTHEAHFDPVLAIHSYPPRCRNRLLGAHGSYICDTPLLETRSGQPRPLKPFLMASFREHLVKLLANKEIEFAIDSACDNVMSLPNEGGTRPAKTPFDTEFLMTFNGPNPGQLFVDRGDKVRLAFVIHLDFFNPNGVSSHSNSDSIGLVSLALLNLPVELRYQPENLYLAIIPGPREPKDDEINHYLHPIVDEFLVGWERGFHISQTALSPENGRDVEIAIVISLNDMPAARKVSGTAGHTSHFICTRCTLFGVSKVHDIECHKWVLQDTNLLKQKAEEWRDAETVERRKEIFKEYHVRWSELWRLPYWNPPRMLVVDVMHCILEGCVHYHCRRVLRIDAEQAAMKDPPPAAFPHDWTSYPRPVPGDCQVRNQLELKHASKIQEVLLLPFTEDDIINSELGFVNTAELSKKLLRNNKQPLKFVCFTLELLGGAGSESQQKKDFVDLLIKWVRIEKAFRILNVNRFSFSVAPNLLLPELHPPSSAPRKQSNTFKVSSEIPSHRPGSTPSLTTTARRVQGLSKLMNGVLLQQSISQSRSCVYGVIRTNLSLLKQPITYVLWIIRWPFFKQSI